MHADDLDTYTGNVVAMWRGEMFHNTNKLAT